MDGYAGQERLRFGPILIWGNIGLSSSIEKVAPLKQVVPSQQAAARLQVIDVYSHIGLFNTVGNQIPGITLNS